MSRQVGTLVLLVFVVAVSVAASWGAHSLLKTPGAKPDDVVPSIRTHELVVVDGEGKPRVVICASDTATIMLKDPHDPEHCVTVCQNSQRARIVIRSGKRTVVVDPEDPQPLSIQDR